jgi:uncharacterized cofD-like protein
VATAAGEVVRVALEPADPPACEESIEAIRPGRLGRAGAGSWFTSLIPHLLVPELRIALQDSDARKLVVLNLVPQVGETDGFSPERHLEVLRRHAPLLDVDVVLADAGQIDDDASLRAAAGALGRIARRRGRRLGGLPGPSRHFPSGGGIRPHPGCRPEPFAAPDGRAPRRA